MSAREKTPALSSAGREQADALLRLARSASGTPHLAIHMRDLERGVRLFFHRASHSESLV